MKTEQIITSYERVQTMLKTTRKGRQAWRRSYNGLGRLLHDLQMKSAQPITFPIFKEIGIPTTGTVKREEVLALIPADNWVIDKKGEKYPAYPSRSAKKDDNGEFILDSKGEKVYEYSMKPVKEGMWTLDMLTRVLAAK